MWDGLWADICAMPLLLDAVEMFDMDKLEKAVPVGRHAVVDWMMDRSITGRGRDNVSTQNNDRQCVGGAATCGVASAQQSGLYVFNSQAQGACPALAWHVTLNATGTGDNLLGMIGWGDNMQHIARVTGRLDPNTKRFQMTAHELGGAGRTANIDGVINASGSMVANISGEGVNCKSVTILR